MIVLDSAGHGPFTITQSVSIVAPAGVYAGISVSSGDGITVNAGAADVVKLHGLTINGFGGGVNGIVANTVGLLEVEDVHVSGFSFRGLYFAASDVSGGEATSGRLTVTNSVFENNGESGLHAQAASGVATVTIDQSRFDRNAANGAVIATHATGSILRSIASHNASVGFLIDAGGIATLADCKVSNTYDAALRFGILVRGTGTKAMIARCDVFGKGQGYVVDDGAQAQVTDSSAETHGTGFLALHSGSLMVAERSTAIGNAYGFMALSGATLSMSNCTSTFNYIGALSELGITTPGTIETRVNNTFRDNSFLDTLETPKAFGPI